MHVFISYAKKDTRALALLLRDRLRALPGVTAWMDESLEAGASWAAQIQEEIDRCDYMVVLLSPDVNRPASAGRSFVLNEIDYAQSLRKPIIPVLAQPTRVPVQIAGIQYVDLTADQDAGIERLIRRVQRINNEGQPDVPAQPEPVKPSLVEKKLPQKRLLEAAMPACTRPGTETEVRVKISLPNSLGLRGELPDVLPSGDVIQKGDVRSTSFQMPFRIDEKTGQLLPGTVCVEVTAADFVVHAARNPSAVCGDNQVELEVLPDDDSRTVIFDLTPSQNQTGTGLARIFIRLYCDSKLVAETSVATRMVDNLADDPNCTFWWLSSSLVARQQPAPVPAPAPLPPGSQMGGHDNTQINVGTMSGGSVVGKQTNYGTPPPMSPRPQDMPLPSAPPKRSSRNLRALGGVLVVMLTLSFGFLALFPEQARTDWFRGLGLLPALPTDTPTPTDTATPTLDLPNTTPTQIVELGTTATEAMFQLTADAQQMTNDALLAERTRAAQTATAVIPSTTPPVATPITTSGLAIGMQAEVRASNETGTYQNLRTGVTRNHPVIQQVPVGTIVTIIDGPVASEDRIWWKVRAPDGVEGWMIESSSSRQTLLPVERAATLRLIVTSDSLTLVVTSPTALNLNGLEFRVADGQGGTQTVQLTASFDILQLTGGMAEPGSCFVSREAGTTSPLPSACTQPEKVFRREVPRADVFWYDFTANRQRDVAVLRDSDLLTVCAAAATECAIEWNVN